MNNERSTHVSTLLTVTLACAGLVVVIRTAAAHDDERTRPRPAWSHDPADAQPDDQDDNDGADDPGYGRALDQVLRRLEREIAGLDPAARAQVKRGATAFFRPFPGGNGRACATCHVPRDGFALSPVTVERRWRRLQEARKSDPGADDPLFRPIDADDGKEDFTLLRTRALIKVRVPLPPAVRLTADPAATTVTVSRVVPPLNLLAHTAPYQSDNSAATLEQQAAGAVAAHMQPTTPPSEEFLDDVAAFQRHLFASGRDRRIDRALRGGDRAPEVDPPLDAQQQRGKERFQILCAACHGGPAQVTEDPAIGPIDIVGNAAVIGIMVSNPPPPGFPPSPIQVPASDLPAPLYTISLTEGPPWVVPSSDPGALLTHTGPIDPGAARTLLGSFAIPTLRGINQTAPYFHDHRAATLEDAVLHYQAMFVFLRSLGIPLPLLEDEDVAPLVAYIRRAF